MDFVYYIFDKKIRTAFDTIKLGQGREQRGEYLPSLCLQQRDQVGMSCNFKEGLVGEVVFSLAVSLSVMKDGFQVRDAASLVELLARVEVLSVYCQVLLKMRNN